LANKYYYYYYYYLLLSSATNKIAKFISKLKCTWSEDLSKAKGWLNSEGK